MEDLNWGSQTTSHTDVILYAWKARVFSTASQALAVLPLRSVRLKSAESLVPRQLEASWCQKNPYLTLKPSEHHAIHSKNKTKKSYLVGTQCTIVLIDLIIDVQLLWIVLGYINPMSFECWKFRSGGFSGSGCPQPIGKMERNRRNRLLLGAFSDVPHEKNLLLTQNYQQ